jgi:hypothetical protein
MEGRDLSGSTIRLANYYARTRLLGEAIDLAHHAARAEPTGIADPQPVYAEVVDDIEEGLNVLIPNRLYHDPVLHTCPVEADAEFVSPQGIVAGADQPEGVDVCAIREGFVVLNGPENAWTIQAVIGRERLLQVWRKLVAQYTHVDAFIIQILDHFDNHLALREPGLGDNIAEVWVKDVDFNVAELSPFLNGLEVDLLQNGHVDFGVHSTTSEATLWLTEHKTLRLVTESEKFREQVVKCVSGDFSREELLSSFEDNGCSHYHYRPHGSRDRKSLTRWLRSTGWDAQGRSDNG